MTWLNLPQIRRYEAMYWLRYALTRASTQRHLHSLRNIRRLWRWAKARGWRGTKTP